MGYASNPSSATGQGTGTLHAPVGGWNTRDALAAMKQEYAIKMDNWFPDQGKITIRKGFASHATGIGSGAVESLLEYNGLSANKMFACGNSAIYDATSAGAVGAASVSALTNNRWQYVNIGTAGGQFLFCCNGADTARTFDGTSWANSTLTGPTLANLIWCNTHQTRLFVGEINKLSFWYGGANAITGAFSEFSLAGVAKRGGFIMAMGTWTRDGGAGPDDVAVFLTSEGEAILYSGTNPGDASVWSLVGVFRVGNPIGRRCLFKAGSDLILICEDGFLPMSAVLPIDRAQSQTVAISDVIQPTVSESVRSYGTVYGWQGLVYPKGKMLIFNVPLAANTTAHQYTFNSITGAACRFTGVNANCWGILNNNAYFGGIDGTVYKFDTGTSDNSADIQTDLQQAFSYFGKKSTNKLFKLIRPIFESTGSFSPVIMFNVDFGTNPTTTTPTVSSGGPLWDTAVWDTDVWGGEIILKQWISVSGTGFCASARMRVDTNEHTISLLATDFVYQQGIAL